MTKITNGITAFCTALFLLTLAACGGGGTAVQSSSDVTTSIPADATGVFVMNAKQMMEKVDYENVKQLDFFKDMTADVEKEAPELLPFLEDPKSTGISLDGNIGVYFSLPEDFMTSNKADVALLAPVADLAKLDAVIELISKEDGVTKEAKDGYELIIIEDNLMLVKSPQLLAFTSFGDDAKIQTLLKPSGSINDNANFKKRFDSGKDIGFWMNMDPILKAAMANPMTAMMVTGGLASAQISEDALKGNTISFDYHFKKGEITNNSHFDFSQPLIDALGDLFPDKLVTDYSKYITAENAAAILTVGVDADGLVNFLTSRGYNAALDQNLAMAGLSLEKLKAAIAGDLGAAVYAPKAEGADPGLLLTVGLKDKTVIETLVQQMGATAGDNGYQITLPGNSMDPSATPKTLNLIIEDDVMIIANNPEILATAQSGNADATVADLQKGWFGTHLDYTILEKHQTAIMEYFDLQQDAMNDMMMQYQVIEKVLVTSEGSDMLGLTTFKNKSDNSLKEIVNMMNKMYKDREKIEQEMERQMQEDFEDFDAEFGTEEVEENT